jgi:hypothetical protein
MAYERRLELILHNFDGVAIPFDPAWKNIAISLSGGCDSALLTHQLCTLVEDTTIHIISHVRMWRTRPWQKYNSLDVFNYFVNKFPDIKFVRHENFIPPELEGKLIGDKTGNQIITRSYAEYVCIKESISAYYAGDTLNPADVTGGPVDRSIEGTTMQPIREHLGGFACQPYSVVHKDYVVSQYKKLDLWDLFNITRSCEGEFEELNQNNYVPGQPVPTCGVCFWCRERQWGIDNAK